MAITFDYIASEIRYSSDAAFINDDGTKTLLSTMVPKDEEGNDFDFGVATYNTFSLMHNMTVGDVDGDGSDEIIFSDYRGNVAAMSLDDGNWTFDYIASEIPYSSDAAFINDDGTKTLLSTMVPKDEEGNDFDFGVATYNTFSLMHNMTVGDVDGDGSDEIIFSDYRGNVAAMSLDDGNWTFDYIASEIPYSSDAAFINDDGTKTLLSTMVPKDEEGNDFDFGVATYNTFSLMHNMTVGDVDGDGSDEIIFSDYRGNVAAMSLDDGNWTFDYIASEIRYSSDAAFINDDGTKTLLSTMVPKDEEGNDFDFGVATYNTFSLMHNMTVGDVDGDGSDEIIFSDYRGNVAAMSLDDGNWTFDYIASEIPYSSDAAFINDDGTKTLLSTMVPKDEEGNDFDFGVATYNTFSLMHNMTVGDVDGDGSDEIIFSDYRGNVAAMSLDDGNWTFDYIASEIPYSSDAAFINDDGTKTLLSTMVPKDEEGNDFDFGVATYNTFSLMHNMTVGDVDDDGSDEIIFSDYRGNVAAMSNQYTKILSTGGLHFQTSSVVLVDDTGTLLSVRAAGLEPTNTNITSATLELSTAGAVDINDVVLQLRHIVGLERLEGVNAAAADNNADGNVDISDVVQSLRQIVGLAEAPIAKVVSTSGQDSFSFDETVTALTAIAPGDADLSWIPTDLI